MNDGSQDTGTGNDTVIIGKVTRPHGIRGAVRVRPFGDPSSLESCGPLLLPDGRQVQVRVLSVSKGTALCAIEGIADRNAAEEIVNAELAVSRSALPNLDEEEFYHADLVGLSVCDTIGVEWGCVVAVHNFGAGDVIDVQPSEGGTSVMIPFTRESVLKVDLDGRVAVADPSWVIDGKEKLK